MPEERCFIWSRNASFLTTFSYGSNLLKSVFVGSSRTTDEGVIGSGRDATRNVMKNVRRKEVYLSQVFWPDENGSDGSSITGTSMPEVGTGVTGIGREGTGAGSGMTGPG